MKRKKNKIEQAGNNFQKLVETVRQLDKERREIQKTRDSDGSDCSCGSGKLGPKQYNDGQFMGGFTVSRKCKKCGMLHFFQS